MTFISLASLHSFIPYLRLSTIFPNKHNSTIYFISHMLRHQLFDPDMDRITGVVTECSLCLHLCSTIPSSKAFLRRSTLPKKIQPMGMTQLKLIHSEKNKPQFLGDFFASESPNVYCLTGVFLCVTIFSIPFYLLVLFLTVSSTY